MKKIVLFFCFLLLFSHLYAQTRPHWLDLKGTPVVDVRSYGAIADDLIDDTAAFASAIADGKHVIVPKGTFRISHLPINSGAIIEGQGPDVTVLQAIATTSVPTIQLGKTAPASGVAIRDLTIKGNTTALCGLQLGEDSASYIYAAIISLDNVFIKDFTGLNSSAVRLVCGLEIDFNNVSLMFSTRGIHRPIVANPGTTSVTSFRMGGSASRIITSGRKPEATWTAAGVNADGDMGIGVHLESGVSQLRLNNVVLENNARAAFSAENAPGRYVLNSCYFEVNNHTGLATATVYFDGGNPASPIENVAGIVAECDFIANSSYATGTPTVGSDYAQVTLRDVVGLYLSRPVGTANSRYILSNNADAFTSNSPLENIPAVATAPYGGLDFYKVSGIPLMLGTVQLRDGLYLGADYPWDFAALNTTTAKVISGNKTVGNCTTPQDVGLFKLVQNTSSGGAIKNASVMAFINISQSPAGNAPARGAAGWFTASTAVASTIVNTAADIKMSFSAPFPGALVSLSIASYTNSISPYEADVGLNISSLGSPNQGGPIYVQFYAITSGDVSVVTP